MSLKVWIKKERKDILWENNCRMVNKVRSSNTPFAAKFYILKISDLTGTVWHYRNATKNIHTSNLSKIKRTRYNTHVFFIKGPTFPCFTCARTTNSLCCGPNLSNKLRAKYHWAKLIRFHQYFWDSNNKLASMEDYCNPNQIINSKFTGIQSLADLSRLQWEKIGVIGANTDNETYRLDWSRTPQFTPLRLFPWNFHKIFHGQSALKVQSN
jgi:hypothetical protein